MARMWGPLKHALYVGLSVCALGGVAAELRAQTCHGQFRPSIASETSQVTLGTNFVSAGFETPRFTGHYEGLGAELGWTEGRTQLAATWTAYRISRNGADAHGFGDPALAARFRISDEPMLLRAGAGLALAAPMGEPKHDLGMGHFMVTPEVWSELGSPLRYLASSIAYSRALGVEGHHGHGLRPLVAAMTESEVTVELRAGMRALPKLSLETRGRLAIPVGAAGEPRAFVTGAVGVPFASGESSVELSLPLTGEAFDWRFGTHLRWFL